MITVSIRFLFVLFLVFLLLFVFIYLFFNCTFLLIHVHICIYIYISIIRYLCHSQSCDRISSHCLGGPLTGMLSFSTTFFSLAALLADEVATSGGEVVEEVVLGGLFDDVKRDITTSKLDGVGVGVGVGAGVDCAGWAGLSGGGGK